jgi:spore maturation protein A
LLSGALTGRMEQVMTAATAGAEQAVNLLLSIAGLMCFWSGVMEVVARSGLADRIAGLLRPLLQLLFERAADDREAMETVSTNMTANLLGLSNAATPSGLAAARQIYRRLGERGTPNEVLTLITLNTTSIQLLPSTVAAVRASCGAASPFDIMPAVWGASIASVVVVLLAGRLLRGAFPDR